MKKSYKTEKTLKGYIFEEGFMDTALIEKAEVIDKVTNKNGKITYLVKASKKDIKKRWLPLLNQNAFMYFYMKNHAIVVFKDIQFHFNYIHSNNWKPVIKYALENGFSKEQLSFPIEGKIHYEL